jgi:hypothetical protein
MTQRNRVKKGEKKQKGENVPKKEWKKSKELKKKPIKGKTWTKLITPITCVFLVPNFNSVCDWVY